jgi:hypothetical protein
MTSDERRSAIHRLLLALLVAGVLATGGAGAQDLGWTVYPCDLPGSGATPTETRTLAAFLNETMVVTFADEVGATLVSLGTAAESAEILAGLAVGIDGLHRSGQPVTTATPPSLASGATYGVGINLVTRRGSDEWRGSSVLAQPGGSDIQLAGRASLRTDQATGRSVIEFPLATFPAGIDRVRVTVVLNEVVCAVLGDPTVDDGYLPAEAIDPALRTSLDAIDGSYHCHPAASTCVLLPGDVSATPTGDGMLGVVFRGLNFDVQFSTSGGRTDDILGNFRSASWTLADPAEVVSDFRSWQGFDLISGDRTLGTLAVSDNGSSTNPAVFAVSAISPGALTPEQMGVATELMRVLAHGFNSAFERLP